LDKEVIFKDNLQKIFGDRPFEKLKNESATLEKAEPEEETNDSL